MLVPSYCYKCNLTSSCLSVWFIPEELCFRLLPRINTMFNNFCPFAHVLFVENLCLVHDVDSLLPFCPLLPSKISLN